MSAIVHPIALSNLFSSFTKLSTCCSFRYDAMITGKVSPFPKNSYLRCGGRSFSSNFGASSIDGFAG